MPRNPLTRAFAILTAGILLGLLACGGAYWTMTASYRVMLQQDLPELAWLQREFNLAPEESERISALHHAYLPRCAAYCETIAAHQDKIRHLTRESRELTPEINGLLKEAARVRLECQQSMLDHFFAVSRAMSPEQGRRYLLWVQEKAFHMDHERNNQTGSRAGHGHGHH